MFFPYRDFHSTQQIHQTTYAKKQYACKKMHKIQKVQKCTCSLRNKKDRQVFLDTWIVNKVKKNKRGKRMTGVVASTLFPLFYCNNNTLYQLCQSKNRIKTHVSMHVRYTFFDSFLYDNRYIFAALLTIGKIQETKRERDKKNYLFLLDICRLSSYHPFCQNARVFHFTSQFYVHS